MPDQVTPLILESGSHASREAGVCAMEAVAWLAGEPHSDAPQCASKVLTSLLIRLVQPVVESWRELLAA